MWCFQTWNILCSPPFTSKGRKFIGELGSVTICLLLLPHRVVVNWGKGNHCRKGEIQIWQRFPSTWWTATPQLLCCVTWLCRQSSEQTPRYVVKQKGNHSISSCKVNPPTSSQNTLCWQSSSVCKSVLCVSLMLIFCVIMTAKKLLSYRQKCTCLRKHANSYLCSDLSKNPVFLLFKHHGCVETIGCYLCFIFIRESLPMHETAQRPKTFGSWKGLKRRVTCATP